MMPTTKTWVIITSGEASLQPICDQLKTKGFTIDATMDAIGQIIAKGTEDMKREGLKIKGVQEIVPVGDDINIGRPGNGDITW